MEPKYAALVQYRMETSLLPYWSLYPVSSHSWVAFSYLSMQYKCFPMHYIYQGIFKKDSCHPTTTFKFRQWCPAIQVASDWSYWILNPNKDVALASCHLRADLRMMKPCTPRFMTTFSFLLPKQPQTRKWGNFPCKRKIRNHSLFT